MLDFKNRTVMITGAAGNLGRAVASAFGMRGANLVLVDLDADALDALQVDHLAELEQLHVAHARVELAENGAIEERRTLVRPDRILLGPRATGKLTEFAAAQSTRPDPDRILQSTHASIRAAAMRAAQPSLPYYRLRDELGVLEDALAGTLAPRTG